MNLFADFLEPTESTPFGQLKLNYAHPGDMSPENSCALDVADRGEHTLEEIAAVSRISDEWVRQIAWGAIAKVEQRGGAHLRAVAEADERTANPVEEAKKQRAMAYLEKVKKEKTSMITPQITNGAARSAPPTSEPVLQERVLALLETHGEPISPKDMATILDADVGRVRAVLSKLSDKVRCTDIHRGLWELADCHSVEAQAPDPDDERPQEQAPRPQRPRGRPRRPPVSAPAMSVAKGEAIPPDDTHAPDRQEKPAETAALVADLERARGRLRARRDQLQAELDAASRALLAEEDEEPEAPPARKASPASAPRPRPASKTAAPMSKTNVERALDYLRTHAGATTGQVAEAIGLSTTAVSGALFQARRTGRATKQGEAWHPS